MEIKMDFGTYGDSDILTDLLCTQEFLTQSYNRACAACESAAIKDEFLKVLNEEQSIQYELLQEMKKRGFYQAYPADAARVDEVKKRFTKQP